jgi:anti-sigma factor RsiW
LKKLGCKGGVSRLGFKEGSGMHDVVIDELERHFSGNATRGFYAHLDTCSECRSEVAAMDETALLLQELRTGLADAFPVPPGFYNKVSFRIVEQERRHAWGLFSPGVAFFRRVAFASLLVLAGLGSYLIMQENSPAATGMDAATVMAQHDPTVSHENGGDRDHMLVTLSNYHE